MNSIYFIGIKGVGMSALALVAKGMGYSVSGSDTAEEFITDPALKKAGIAVWQGFAAEHLSGVKPDLVVIGAAYGQDNPEVAAAHQAGLKCWTYSELQAFLAKDQLTVAVAGTHGKTTTTSLLSYLLYHSGQQPSFIIGTGRVAGLPAHGHAGQGRYFVTEADDYKRAPDDPTPKFLDLSPYLAIITSIEHDHPDLFPTLADCLAAFYQFAQRLDARGSLIVNADDENISQLRQRLTDKRLISYGFSDTADWRIMLLATQSDQPTRFRLIGPAQAYGPFELALPGRHNAANAAAAIVAALELGVRPEAIEKLLPQFRTVERRFEIVGERAGVTVVDDYAHHPTAIAVTLAAAKERWPRRPIWCLFQAHTYSRTKALLNDFAWAFDQADRVIITDIFASAREGEATITAQDLTAAIAAERSDTTYVPMNQLVEHLRTNLPRGAVLITMGAGDIYKIGRQFLEPRA